jgi:hypothetical protein
MPESPAPGNPGLPILLHARIFFMLAIENRLRLLTKKHPGHAPKDHSTRSPNSLLMLSHKKIIPFKVIPTDPLSPEK